ncbi:MAG: glycosyltransferase family 2 protein [Verrucomicrobiales bacterium]|nr:glycosyltransferase family 2 protein [Verrucomicrobiales bacterium]
MSAPRLSVVIPNYNHAKLLPTCLTAVMEQSVPADEVIVIDDGSKDDSRLVLAEFAARYPRLRLEPNERNLGVVPTMNRGLGLARGDYVAFLAADDKVLPGWLEKTLPQLERHAGVGLVCGLTEWRCHSTGMTWRHGTRMPTDGAFLDPEAMVRLGRSGRLTISGQHALMNKAALLAAGGWKPELRWFTDWFATCVIAFRHGMVHVPDVLSVFNLHATSYYNTAESNAQRRETMLRILEYLESEPYADVASRIGASGLLGGFGLPMMRLVGGSMRHRRFLTAGFLRHAARRGAEVAGRRFLPAWLARACLKVFYRGR